MINKQMRHNMIVIMNMLIMNNICNNCNKLKNKNNKTKRENINNI